MINLIDDMNYGTKTLPFETASAVLAYDPDSGVLTWRVSSRRMRKGKEAGFVHINPNTGYRKRVVRINKVPYIAHRIAWLLYYGTFPDGEIDHINRDTLDNRISNLRIVNRFENMQNRDCRGYHFNKQRGKYMSRIKVYGKQIYLGLFDTPEDARKAYLDAKKLYHISTLTGTGTGRNER